MARYLGVEVWVLFWTTLSSKMILPGKVLFRYQTSTFSKKFSITSYAHIQGDRQIQPVEVIGNRKS